jgi:glycosyltransferase involved in cell wall biosynthesis
MSTLSIIIITKNEQRNIKRCLDSVQWADEIIVLDSGSTDDTLQICKQYTPHVFSTDWPGYGVQKARALEKASCEWVLSIDADEQVSDALKKRIQDFIASASDVRGIYLPIKLIFLGRRINHANGSSKHLRLFKREAAQFTQTVVHEDLIVTGASETWAEPLYHYSFDDISQLVGKMNHYTSLVAQQRLEQKRHGSMRKAVTHSAWMFIKIYFLKLGFLDGAPGLILAYSFAEGAFYRYAKMCYPEKDA